MGKFKFSKKEEGRYCVYMLRCADGSIYTGMTLDIERRVDEHNGEPGTKSPAMYTRSRRPVELVFIKYCASRGDAASLESAIKTGGKDRRYSRIKELQESGKYPELTPCPIPETKYNKKVKSLQQNT